VAEAARWLRNAVVSARTVAASYLWMPVGTRLWSSVDDYEELDTDRIRRLLAPLATSH
jgi:hypothetical protein